jgi:hypothetical protein
LEKEVAKKIYEENQREKDKRVALMEQERREEVKMMEQYNKILDQAEKKRQQELEAR